MEDQFLTAQEVAAILKISRAHAYRLIRRGDIGALYFGYSVRVSRAALLRYLREKAPRHLAEEALRALEKGAGDE
jgi:excisionase family DNA binding protein